MKKSILFLFAFIPIIVFAQENYIAEAKKELKPLDSVFKKYQNQLTVAKDSLKTLTEILSPNISSYYEEVMKIKYKTDSIYTSAKIVLDYYKQKKVPQDTLNSIFSLPPDYMIGEEKKKIIPEETYVLFGGENLILKESILTNPIANKVLKSVFSSESETHFGDFWFPMDGQEIPIIPDCIKKSDNEEERKKCKEPIRKLKFDYLEIEIYEGSLSDIKVHLKNNEGKAFVFENRSSVSLLKFNNLSGRNYLEFTSIQTPDSGNPDFSNYWIKVSDVLQYHSGLNGNYIPNDERFKFPIVTETGKTNSHSSNRYELRQSTSLNNILDLRTYTDLLGVGGTTPNGIAQFEGQADFFINPFRSPRFLCIPLPTDFYFFKKIRPYVIYARLDEENQYLEIEDSPTMQLKTISDPLSHIQKSYLDAGLKLDVFSFKFGKSFPFEAQFYGVARYQIARIKVDSISDNYKTLGTGGGLALEFRRLKNFKLNISSELIKYNQENYNNIPRLTDPEPFLVFRNEAEVSYYLLEEKKSAIFMRLRVYDNQDSDEGSNFFQWQFGYRFTLGMGKIKTDN